MRPGCSVRRTASGAAPGSIPEGMELQNGRVALRLPFPQRVNGPGPLRAVLVQMAEAAGRSRTA